MPQTRPWRDPAACALILCAALMTMANSTISPALPGIEALYPEHPNAALLTRYLVPAPSITALLFAPFVGMLADRLGRRPLLLAGLALYIVAGAAPLVPMSLEMIFATRLVLGVAVALVLTTTAALVGDLFQGARRAAVLGLQISARNLGGMLGIVGAGFLAGVSATLPFGLYLLALAVLWITWRGVREQPQSVSHAGTAETVVSQGWVVPLTAICALQLATAMLFFTMPTQIPFFLQSLGYHPARATGLVMGALTLAGGVTALGYRTLATATGPRAVLGLGFGAMAGGFFALTQPLGMAGLVAGAALVGVGFALVSPALPALGLTSAPGNRRGVAMGALTTAIYLGQILSPLASQRVIEAQGFAGLYLGAALATGALGLAACLRGRRALA